VGAREKAKPGLGRMDLASALLHRVESKRGGRKGTVTLITEARPSYMCSVVMLYGPL